MNLTLMMRGFTVRTRMLGTVAIVALALLCVAAVGIAGQFYSRGVSSSFVKQEFAAMTHIAQLRTTMSALRGIEKDMIIQYGKKEKVAALNKSWAATFEQISAGAATLGAMLTKPEQKEKVTEAMARLGRFKSRFESVARTLESEGFDSGLGAATFMARAQVEYDGAQDIIAALAVDIDKAAGEGSKKLEATADLIIGALGAAAGLALLLILPMTLLNMSSIVKPIREAELLARQIEAGDLTSHNVDTRGKDEAAQLLGTLQRMQASLASMVGQVRASTDSISTASSEIATGNQDLSSRTEQTASNLQQAASSMEQLTGTVRQSADSARQANQLASSAAEVAARGGSVVSQVVTTMDEINASSKKISDIIGVIDGIAFQTNILALNAAVEAARAGEQGRGFAVVAAEVRSLAQRSAQAAKEIKGLIGASVDRVEVGSRLVADAGKTMQEIVGSVQRVTDIIGEITAASSEQSDGISQVSTAVSQLDRMTQQNAALVEESAAAAESLKDQAQRLAQAVGTFKLDAGTQAAAHRAPVVHKPAASASAKVAGASQPASKAAASKPKPAAHTAAKPAASAAAKPAKPAALPAASTAPAASTFTPAPVAAKPTAATGGDDGDWESF